MHRPLRLSVAVALACLCVSCVCTIDAMHDAAATATEHALGQAGVWDIAGVTGFTPGPNRWKPVPRRAWDDTDPDFPKKIAMGMEPVLLENAPPRKWPALEKWTREYLIEKEGDRDLAMVWTQRTPTYVHADQKYQIDEWNGRPVYNNYTIDTMTFKQFLARIDANSDAKGHGDYVYYSGPVRNFTNIKEDLEPYQMMIAGKQPHFGLWIGGQGVTARMHYDLQDNFYSQVRGQKKFTLLPPHEAWKLNLFSVFHPSYYSCQTDPYSKDLGLDGWEIILEPGDLLYLPTHFLHQVSSVTNSISASLHATTASIDPTFDAIRVAFRAPLPMEGSWDPLSMRVVLRVIIRVLADHFFGLERGPVFTAAVYDSRFAVMFPRDKLNLVRGRELCPPLEEALMGAPLDKDLAEVIQESTPASQRFEVLKSRTQKLVSIVSRPFADLGQSLGPIYLANYFENLGRVAVDFDELPLFMGLCL